MTLHGVQRTVRGSKFDVQFIWASINSLSVRFNQWRLSTSVAYIPVVAYIRKDGDSFSEEQGDVQSYDYLCVWCQLGFESKPLCCSCVDFFSVVWWWTKHLVLSWGNSDLKQGEELGFVWQNGCASMSYIQILALLFQTLRFTEINAF